MTNNQLAGYYLFTFQIQVTLQLSNTFNDSDFEAFTVLEGHGFVGTGAAAAAAAANGQPENCSQAITQTN